MSLITKNESRIGIIGLGYVGLPLALRFVQSDMPVVGFDIDESKITSLHKGKSYIKSITDENASEMLSKGFKATSDFSKISEVDAIIICVPTPLNKYREPDLSYIHKTLDSILPYLKKNQLMSLESTTYPGTTSEILVPLIERSGLKIGQDFFLVFSPEREDPGRIDFNTQTIPKVIGGVTEQCLKVGKTLYEKAIDKMVPVSSTEAAELTKLLENIHRVVNIGLVNEMKVLADRMDIDIYEVINAAATKPFGFVPYYPGPGIGGHCIPIDPFYLTWKAKEFGLNTRFIELAGEINNQMTEYVHQKVIYALNKHKKSLNGSKVLILGISYKKNIDDPRESPSMKIMELLRKDGAIIEYSDPFFKNFPKMREHKFDLCSVPLTPQNIASFDCIVIATNHDDFDYQSILEHSKLIVDCHNVYKEKSDKVIKS